MTLKIRAVARQLLRVELLDEVFPIGNICICESLQVPHLFMKSALTWSEYLRNDFVEKQKINPRFSLRSYAKSIAISPAHLSLIFSGKRVVKPALALRLAERFGLTSLETLTRLRNETGELSASPSNHRYLKEKDFCLISEWYYFAILGLADLQTNVAEPQWIAKKLRLPLPVTKRAFRDLLKLKYIEVRKGQFRQVSDPLRTQEDVSSQTVRRYHKQNLQLAVEKIESVDLSLREFVSMTLCLNRKRLPAAKKLIRQFKEEFTDELSAGKKTDVYNLNIQFFPLTEDV